MPYSAEEKKKFIIQIYLELTQVGSIRGTDVYMVNPQSTYDDAIDACGNNGWLFSPVSDERVNWLGQFIERLHQSTTYLVGNILTIYMTVFVS